MNQPLPSNVLCCSDDPWFRGPWFLRVEEVQHLPSRMFYERELFMSNIHDSNPMRSIMRKCAVMYATDYTKCKFTSLFKILMLMYRAGN